MLNKALDVFTLATHGALRSLGKTPVVWQGELDVLWVYWWDSQLFLGFGTEMVLNINLTHSNDTIALYVSTFPSLTHTLSNVDVY
jgi:hypothetical protein